MEAAVVGALVNNILSKLGEVLLKMGEHSSSLEGDIQEMTDELGMIGAKMEDHLSVKVPVLAVQRESMKIMRRLAFDIEDCLDRFLPCVECEEELLDRMNFVHKIQKLKNRVKAVHGQMADSGVKGSQQDSNNAGVDQADPKDIIGIHVGIEKPKQELLYLLLSDRQKLVISVVGFGGTGKTALAKAVYDCDDIKDKFRCRAWAVASKHKEDNGLLTAIQQQLLPNVTPTELRQQEDAWLQKRIEERLQSLGTRCLIVLDDYEKQELKDIMDFFSALRIRIIVTTRFQSVAKACSSADGYVHKMRNLSKEDSKIFLKNMVSFFQNSQLALDDASDAIVHKCDGHPLALISVANHLNDQDDLSRSVCQDTSGLLGLCMEKNKHKNFSKLLQVLMHTYSSLPDNSMRTCLMYTSLFPDDRPISRQTLTSRWLAEGYVEGQGSQNDLAAADDKFKELVDRNIIRPIAESNGKVKTCKAHGIMHQFILHRSTTSNFITSFGAKNRSNFRHLVIENQRDVTGSGMNHNSGPAANSRSQLSKLVGPLKKKVASLFKKSVSKKRRPRSLTIFGTAEEAVYSDITNLQLLKVLDLKECNDFQAGHLEKIYKLMHLKYLSLGKSIRDISDDGLKRLHRLETLDLRKTAVEILPLEIIILPHLAHLFGKFRLNKLKNKKLDKTRVQESKLHTLAGVVVDNNSGFPHLMGDMKQLKKVKIWCEITSTDSNYILLSKAIQVFAKAGMESPVGSRSLSLHLNDSSKHLLNYQHGNDANATSTEPTVFGYLSSLKLFFERSSQKLHGRPSKFEFCKSMCGLEELCLTSTNLTGDDLSELRTLEQLVFLKLVEVRLAGLQIKLGDFPRLRRLCLVVQEPGFPTIQQGALPSPLVSLQLLCEKLTAPISEHIQVGSFGRLQEIALDSKVNEDTIQHWKKKASVHPWRPRVLFLKRVDRANTRSIVKYVPTDEVSTKPPMLCGRGEMRSHTDQGSLEPPTLRDYSEICSLTNQGSLEPPMLSNCSAICGLANEGSLEPLMLNDCGEICSLTSQGSLEPSMLSDGGEICSHSNQGSLEPPMLCNCGEICSHTSQGSLAPPMQGTA